MSYIRYNGDVDQLLLNQQKQLIHSEWNNITNVVIDRNDPTKIYVKSDVGVFEFTSTEARGDQIKYEFANIKRFENFGIHRLVGFDLDSSLSKITFLDEKNVGFVSFDITNYNGNGFDCKYIPLENKSLLKIYYNTEYTFFCNEKYGVVHQCTSNFKYFPLIKLRLDSFYNVEVMFLFDKYFLVSAGNKNYYLCDQLAGVDEFLNDITIILKKENKKEKSEKKNKKSNNIFKKILHVIYKMFRRH